MQAIQGLLQAQLHQSAQSDNQRDYLVDHSVFLYLVDPHGQFIDVYGKDKERKNALNRYPTRCNHIAQLASELIEIKLIFICRSHHGLLKIRHI